MVGARPILVMGICGTGKSTIAAMIAGNMGGVFLDADDHHDAAAVAWMHGGKPLTEDMREGWLNRVAAAVVGTQKRAVLACSALRRAHRDRLRAGVGPFDILFLYGPAELIAARMAARPGHFMPVSLIASQLATLEPPGVDEGALACPIILPPEEIVARAHAAFG